MAKYLLSKTNYFDIKAGQIVEIKEFVKTEKDSCDYYKVVVPGTDKVHYLFTVEIDRDFEVPEPHTSVDAVVAKAWYSWQDMGVMTLGLSQVVLTKPFATVLGQAVADFVILDLSKMCVGFYLNANEENPIVYPLQVNVKL